MRDFYYTVVHELSELLAYFLLMNVNISAPKLSKFPLLYFDHQCTPFTSPRNVTVVRNYRTPYFHRKRYNFVKFYRYKYSKLYSTEGSKNFHLAVFPDRLSSKTGV